MKAVNVDEVLKILHKYGKYIFVTDYKKYSDMVDDIANLKALKQEPKTGHWITWKEAGNEIPSETRFECSVCHDAAQTLCNGLDLLSPYCPSCGADMREGEA